MVLNSHKVHPENDATDTFSYTEKLLLSIGSMALGFSLVFVVYGFGPMYPTAHIRDQIGDVTSKKEMNWIDLI